MSQAMRTLGVVALSMTLATCGGSRDTESPVARGEKLYADTCALCHGANGEGYRADEAPRLAGQELLSHASDSFLRTAILKGRPETTMSAFGRARGGPLTDADADAVLAWMRTWQTAPAVTLDDRVVAGDKARGQSIYDTECKQCHGENGSRGRYVSVANPVFLSSASDAYVRAAIEKGRSGTPMPAFGARLSPASLDDLTALLRSWQRPVEETDIVPPGPGALTDVVINPGGPEPDFDPNAQFVPVDAVKAAMDRGATFVVSDARASGDYVANHIAGSISVPYYNVEPYLPQIPKERFVITYCACPHAASGQAAAVFRAKGYARVAVLDEGVNVWRERGYPMRSGAKP